MTRSMGRIDVRLSIRAWDAPEIELGLMAGPQMERTPALLVAAPWDESDAERHIRWATATRRDDETFEIAWFADFRARWRLALQTERTKFLARLDALGG